MHNATSPHSSRLIDGATAANELGASANTAGEIVDVYAYFGLTDPVKIEIAARAIEEVRQLLDYLGSTLRQYEEPSRLKRFFSLFGPPSRVDSVTLNVVNYASFHAEAKKGTPYVIDISAGLILRTASLCNEYAAISCEKAAPPVTPSIWESGPDGGLFSLVPETEAGKNYARRLLMMAMLFLYGHELSHVSYGHCDFFHANQELSDDERCAVELDADNGSGACAAASIIQNAKVMELLGYVPDDLAAAVIMDFVRDAMMAALMLFVLFEACTNKDSPKYLVPLLRLRSFVAKFVGYLTWAPTAPFGPVVHIGREGLDQGEVNFAFLVCAAELMKTSVGPVLQNASVTPSDVERADYVASVRKRLKDKLIPLQPFGTPQYLAALRKSRGRPR